MSLFFFDFSRIRFSRSTGEDFVRRQRVSMEDMDGSDDGDTLRIYARPSAVQSVLTSELSARRGVGSGNETVITSGYHSAGDGGGAKWRFAAGVTSNADGFLRINAPAGSGQWQMCVEGPVNIKQIGCRDDNSTENGAIINAYIAARVADAAGSLVHIEIDVPTGTDYYYLGQSVVAPGGNNVKLSVRGRGFMRASVLPFGRQAWLASRVVRGSVFRAGLNVNAFSGSLTQAYSQLHLEDIAIIGAGRGTGVGVYVRNLNGNCQFSYKNLCVCNCRAGVVYASAVSCKTMQEGKFYGCFSGEILGLYDAADTNLANTDSVWLGQEYQACNAGIWLQGGYNLCITDSLVQGCAQGIRMGIAGGGYDTCAFKRFHLESNGWYSVGNTHWTRSDCVTATTANDTLSGLGARNGVTPSAGQRVLVTGQTNPAQNGPYTAASGAWSRADLAEETHSGCIYRVTGGTQAGYWQINNTTPVFLVDGDALAFTKRTIEDWDIEYIAGVTSATKVVWESVDSRSGSQWQPFGATLMTSCGRGFDLISASGVEIREQDCEFESRTIDHNATYNRNPSSGIARGTTSAGGSFTHDWGNQGENVFMEISGNITLQPPTNAPKNAQMTYFISQDASVGGHTVTMAAGMNVPGYSDAGNTTSKRCIIVIRKYVDGFWYQESVSPWH
jgi:hypothetical protein